MKNWGQPPGGLRKSLGHSVLDPGLQVELGNFGKLHAHRRHKQGLLRFDSGSSKFGQPLNPTGAPNKPFA